MLAAWAQTAGGAGLIGDLGDMPRGRIRLARSTMIGRMPAPYPPAQRMPGMPIVEPTH
ncbi:hypothethical protein (plasmid) [Ralstonia solanacearum PSI07]|nr:hypothethical protein [Ralstonia solanacearum PSI07]